MTRRDFALSSMPALLISGCHSGTTPARDATLMHNREVGSAVANLDAAVNNMEMRLTGFGPENWRDALASLQTATIRLRTEMDELKRALGYTEAAAPQATAQPPQAS